MLVNLSGCFEKSEWAGQSLEVYPAAGSWVSDRAKESEGNN